MDTYIDTLVWWRESKNLYCFGDGNTVPAIKNVDISIIIGNKRVTLNTDVIQNGTPLQLSQKAMKTANMTLNFKNMQLSMVRQKN